VFILEGSISTGVEAITDISYSSDDGFEFGAEFGAKATDMDINGSCATEVVVAPDLL